MIVTSRKLEQIELQAKLLNYFLGSNKSNINNDRDVSASINAETSQSRYSCRHLQISKNHFFRNHSSRNRLSRNYCDVSASINAKTSRLFLSLINAETSRSIEKFKCLQLYQSFWNKKKTDRKVCLGVVISSKTWIVAVAVLPASISGWPVGWWGQTSDLSIRLYEIRNFLWNHLVLCQLLNCSKYLLELIFLFHQINVCNNLQKSLFR